MTRIGDTTTDVLPPCSGAEGCTQPVVVVILTHTWDHDLRLNDCLGTEVVAVETACEGHAPETVHEARNCMHESEYVILEVPK